MEQAKMLPNNKMAEIELLSHCIQNEDILCEVIGTIYPEDFYDIRNSLIFNALTSLFEKGTNISTTTLIKELGANIAQITITYVGNIISNAIPNKKAAIECVNIIREASQRRNIIKAAQQLLEKSYNTEYDIKKVVGEFESNIDVEDKSKKTVFDMEETMTSTVEVVEENFNRGGKVVGLETGLETLDRTINGFQKGHLNIIAARPAMGKTVFSLNIAERLSRKGTVFYCSLEMNKEELGVRLLASIAKIDAMAIGTGNLKDDKWIEIGKASSVLSNNKLFIDEAPNGTILDVKAKAKKIKLQHGLDVLIIDHLGLIEPHKNFINRSKNEQLDEISWRAKQIAKELNCCVILLSQLNRAPEQRTDHRPILSDLRESGGIEQNADVVIGLYRDEYYNKETEDKGILECIFLKGRSIKIGTVKMAYVDKYQFIGELDTIH